MGASVGRFVGILVGQFVGTIVGVFVGAILGKVLAGTIGEKRWTRFQTFWARFSERLGSCQEVFQHQD